MVKDREEWSNSTDRPESYISSFLGDEVMIDVLTYMVGGISIVAIILLTVLVFQIYNEDHPLNQDRKDV